MGSARSVTLTEMTNLFNYELRNEDAEQWEAAETLAYINKWLEFIHKILTENKSELVQTGSGEITLVAGTDEYALADASMGDLIAIPGGEDSDASRVRLSGIGVLELGQREDRMAHLLAKDDGTTSYSQPSKYYLHGDNLCVLPFPDQAYTLKIVDYIPDYTKLTAVTTDTMPYRNIFNLVLIEGVKILAKNREGQGSGVDAALMELFQDRAMSILRLRTKQDQGFEPYI